MSQSSQPPRIFGVNVVTTVATKGMHLPLQGQKLVDITGQLSH